MVQAMKANVSRGGGFRGALDYTLGENKEAEIVGGNMVGQTPRELSAEFAPARASRPGIKKPVWHCSLALPEGEKLTAEQWDGVTRDFMEKMGFSDEHDFVAVRHQDTKYDHVHIVANRIGQSGKLFYGQQDIKKSIKATQELEKEYGLTVTPGLENGAKRGPTKGEVAEMERTGVLSTRLKLQDLVETAKQGQPHITEFMERLESAGAVAVPSLRKEGELRGFSFAYEGRHFTGKQLGNDFTGKKLREDLNYEHRTEFEAVAQQRDRAKQKADLIGNGGTSKTGRILKQSEKVDERARELAEQKREASREREAGQERAGELSKGLQGERGARAEGPAQDGSKLRGRGEALQNEGKNHLAPPRAHVRVHGGSNRDDLPGSARESERSVAADRARHDETAIGPGMDFDPGRAEKMAQEQIKAKKDATPTVRKDDYEERREAAQRRHEEEQDRKNDFGMGM